jgi:hypothetical protein
MLMAWGFEGLNESSRCITPRLSIESDRPPKPYPMRLRKVKFPEIAELDELETFVGSKKTKFGSGQRSTTSKEL